jgi:hypothetical protein
MARPIQPPGSTDRVTLDPAQAAVRPGLDEMGAGADLAAGVDRTHADQARPRRVGQARALGQGLAHEVALLLGHAA